VKDEANAVVNQRLPGLLAELCGVEVEEYDSLAPDMGNEIELLPAELATCSPVRAVIWCDVLQPKGAEVVGRYTQEYYAGWPAVTLHRFGKGKVVYIGALGGADLYEALAGWLLGLANVEPILSAPQGVEVTERWQGDRRLLFVLNHSDEEHEIALGRSLRNLLNGESIGGSAAIAPKDVLVLVQA
jgi:beta-galactosidase